MRETPVDNAFTRGGVVRADGRVIRPVYLLQVKRPEEFRKPNGIYIRSSPPFLATKPSALCPRADVRWFKRRLRSDAPAIVYVTRSRTVMRQCAFLLVDAIEHAQDTEPEV